ncbi:glycoside hydrolase family 2, partial [Sesbania bispinosa]
GGQTRRDGCGEGDSGRTEGDSDKVGGKRRGQAARRCDAPPHVAGGGVAEALHDGGSVARTVGVMMKMVVANGGHGAARGARGHTQLWPFSLSPSLLIFLTHSVAIGVNKWFL